MTKEQLMDAIDAILHKGDKFVRPPNDRANQMSRGKWYLESWLKRLEEVQS